MWGDLITLKLCMFLVALFMLLYILFGYIYMLLLLNRTKVCLQSICSQVQEKGRKSERLMKETRTYDCTKIPMSRSTPKRHFIEWRSKYSWFQEPRVMRKIQAKHQKTKFVSIGQLHPIGCNPQPIRMEMMIKTIRSDTTCIRSDGALVLFSNQHFGSILGSSIWYSRSF